LYPELGTAQDAHFTQYFSSPLTLNPANAGNFDGPMRLATNYRNQWQGIGEPYVTGTFSFDSEILKDKMGKGNRLAVGILGLFDKNIGGGFNSNYLSATLGYHLLLNGAESDKLSIGFQSTYANKRLDNSILSYANQFTSGGFDLTLPSNEPFTSGSVNYIDFNAGISYSHKGENGGFYIGSALYHILNPSESFYNRSAEKLPMRINLNGGGTVTIAEYDRLHFTGLFMSQAGINQSTFGILYEKNLPSDVNDLSITLGAFTRLKDAIIPYVGTKYNDIQLGLTYDITNSSLNSSQTRNRSFELALIYTFRDRSEQKRYTPWY
jgi:type IX secretion system PorP/SprF family membrane protein